MTLGKAASVLGIHPATVTGWVNGDLVHPIGKARGRCGYSVGQRCALELIAVRELTGVGFTYAQMRPVISALPQALEKRIAEDQFLIATDGELMWADSAEAEKRLQAAWRDRKRFMLFPIGELYAAFENGLDGQGD